ncbi:toll/interleukin-1 receptor domain-containing protein [Anaerococcus sp. Marseille-P9784]|uniref:toll/interleukin-1 receptor domain-containing protein n=1 Tax=Anaerococcus sp. Marseille-P9784 TaxID=2614127 RepID=UPI00124A681F|nr:toll/interleukin-1 receptor domain-containing protein [Anaerococcus sp. Marseille-P9784]
MTTTTKGKIKIFISYGRTESEIFKKIVAYLESKGYEVWFDQTKIKGTDDWRENIIKGIRESQTVIAGLSEHFLRKGGVCSEEMGIALAIKSNRIYTIYLEKKEDLDKIPSSLTRRQWVDLSDWEKYKENEKDLDKWLEKEIQPIIKAIESKDNKEFSGQINTIRHALRIPEIGSTKADSYLIKKYTPRDNLDQKVNEWIKEKNGKKITVVYGKPATGKSHYAAEKCHTDYHIAASFFCEYNKENFSTSKSLIRDLAFQLACQIPDYRTALLHQLESIAITKKKINQMGLEEPVDDGQIHIREDYTEAEEFEILIASPLSICIDGDMENKIILIDALDEAGKVERNKLLDIIKNHLNRLPRWIKILILTRPETDIKSYLDDIHEINLDIEENKKDIKTYLEKTFEKENYPNKKEIIETIIEKSQGTFLYAELVAKEILEKTMDKESLDKLPTGLSSYFLNWFSRIYPIEKIDETYKEKDRKAISMILASPRPLPKEELNNLLGWDHSQKNDFIKKLENYLSKKDDLEGNQTIEIAHKYMADWLQSDQASDYKVYKEDGLSYIYKGIEELYTLDKEIDSLTRYEKLNLIDALKNRRGNKALKDFLKNKEAKDKLLDFANKERENYRIESATKLYEDMIDLYKNDEENIFYYSLCVIGYGKILEEIGKEEKSIELLKEVIEKLDKPSSMRDDTVYDLLIVSINNLGILYQSMQNYEEAEIYHKKAINIEENLMKSRNSLNDISLLAMFYGNLGVLYKSMQRYEEAEIYHKKAIELYEDLKESRNSLTDISDLAGSYNNLGYLYYSIQKYEEAEIYYKKATDLREKLKESRNSLKDMSDLAISYNNLGSLCISMQRYEEAEIYHKKAIELYEDLKESRNSLTDISDLAGAYNNLGYLYYSMQRYEESEIYYKKSIELYEELKESRNSQTDISRLAMSYNNLGGLYESMQNYKKSEIYHKKALDLRENIKKSRNSLNDISDLAMSYNNLGDLYESMQRYEESEIYYKKAIDLRENIKESRNSLTDISNLAISYSNLGYLYNSMRRYIESEIYNKKAIDLREDIKKSRNSINDISDLAISYSNLGCLYNSMKKYRESEIYHKKAIDLREELKKIHNSVTYVSDLARSYNNLGFLYESIQRYDESEIYYKKAISLREALKESSNSISNISYLARSYSNLGFLYKVMKEYDESEVYHKKGLVLRENIKELRNSPNDKFELSKSYNNIGSLYNSMQRYEESEIYYKKAIRLLENLKENDGTRSDIEYLEKVYSNLGDLYDKLQRHDEAEEYYKKSNELKKTLE